jgi:putative endopeptidase
MVITAGALEPPFFDLTADPAVNYGAIGTLMASQMAAAFDDNGRHFGGNGGFREILTGGDEARFDSLKQALSAEYSKVEPIPGFPVHGDLVVNEAIDDVVGIQVALDAYHRSLRGQSAKTLDGFTGDQRFFLGRAQMWRAAFVPAFYRVQSATGRNAPPFQRVNGPIRHIDAWYQAFGVSPGDKMYVEPTKRVRFLF